MASGLTKGQAILKGGVFNFPKNNEIFFYLSKFCHTLFKISIDHYLDARAYIRELSSLFLVKLKTAHFFSEIYLPLIILCKLQE